MCDLLVAAEELEVLSRRCIDIVGEIDHGIVVEELIVDGLAAKHLFQLGLGEIEYVFVDDAGLRSGDGLKGHRWWWRQERCVRRGWKFGGRLR